MIDDYPEPKEQPQIVQPAPERLKRHAPCYLCGQRAYTASTVPLCDACTELYGDN